MAPEFEDFAWVDEKELDKYHTMRGIDREVKMTISLFQK